MPEQPPTRPPTTVTVIKLAWCCLLASIVAAGLMFPVVGGFGLISNRASDVVANGSAQLVEGEVPQVSTMVHGWPVPEPPLLVEGLFPWVHQLAL